MNTVDRIQWFLIGFFLLFVAACNPQDVCASEVSSEIATTIERHYSSRATDNLEGYLDTIFFADRASRVRSEISLPSIWQRIRLEQPQLRFIAIRESGSGERGVARYRVEYLLTVKATGDRFPKQEDNIALLEKGETGWQVRRIMSVNAVESHPQALDEQELALWQQDLELIRKLLAISPASEKEEGTAIQENNEGLILSYDFSKEPAEHTVDDLSGNGYTALLHKTVWKGRNGLYLNGTDAYLEVRGGNTIHADRTLTVIGEFITTSYAGKNWQNLVWKGNAPECTQRCENREFSIWLNGGAYLHATSTAKDGIGKGQTELNSPSGSIAGRTVFTLVIDSTVKSMKIFINGKQAASRTYSETGPRRTDGPLVIGGGGPVDTKSHFRGYLRWLRIYDRVLGEEEIAAVTRRNRLDNTGPWSNPYLLDDAVVRGGWATISPIRDDPSFATYDLSTIEPGIVIKDGWFSHPTDRKETEIIYRHDGSPLRFAGHATIIDCLDHCRSTGLVEQIIRGDGKELWHSGTIKQKGPGKDFDVDLTGVHEIRLVTTDGGNGSAQDWAAWLNLRLSVPEKEVALTPAPAAVTIPEPPSIAVAAPPESSSEVRGMIDQIYTLIERPSGSGVTSVETFRSTVDKVYVWFTYSNLEPGTILKGVWLDEGRKLALQEFPVIITQKSGDTGFSIHRPMDGWVRGTYRIDLLSGESPVGTVNFQITK